MKLLAKIVLATAVGGAVYAAPGGWLSPAGPSGGAQAEEMLSRTAVVTQQIQDDYRITKHLQAQARKEKDVIKLTCINDKLVEMKPEMNIVDHARIELQGGRDAAEMRTAFEEVLQAGDTVRRLREAAEACIGKPLIATESSNDFTHPQIPDHPSGDPFGYTLEPPAYASPFM